MNQIQSKNKILLFLTLFLAFIGSGLYLSLNAQNKPQVATANAKDFSVMTYNVENFFDTKLDGTEYPEFKPNPNGWNDNAYKIKLANVVHVLKDASPDIVALEEIENEGVLKDIQKNLKGYEWSAITSKQHSAVQVGILSRFPIKDIKQIGNGARPILRATLDINGTDFYVYANHWRAKPSPESKRVDSAQELKQDIDSLAKNSPYILVGDFNEDYDECLHFLPTLNDTNGVLGIEHIIQTAKSKPNEECKLAQKVDILIQSESKLHYDAWQEIAPNDRWSELYGKKKGTLDHIILSKSVFTDSGISYKDGSFKVFKQPYLLQKDRPFRWHTAERPNEVSEGFSDHLPLIARFSKSGFKPQANDTNQSADQNKTINKTTSATSQKISINEIYQKNEASGDFLLTNTVVIYKSEKSAIIKDPKSRAIEVYGAPDNWKLGDSIDVRFSKITNWNGRIEIAKIFDSSIGKKQDYQKLYINDKNLSDPKLQNEVATNIEGFFSKGYFYYGENQNIKVYFQDKTLRPKGMAKVKLNSAVISVYGNEPQIIIQKQDDWQLVK